MIKFIQKMLLLCAVLLVTSCNNGKKVDIDVADVDQLFNASMFRGAKPEIKFAELCDIVGEPNEYLDKDSDDEKEHSPIYYFEEGKMICHWAEEDDEKYGVGCIDYIPYENKPMYIQDILKAPISDYDITEKTKKVRIYEGDMLYYLVKLDNFRVKEIEYWLVKKKFLNVAF